MAAQIILLLYAKSETSTTGGLETLFRETTFMGIQGLDPLVVLGISIAITLKSCLTLHYKKIKTEKQMVGFSSTIFIYLWGMFSTLRRILSVISFFVPSLGLLSVLYHHKAELLPMNIWKKWNRKTQADLIV